MMMIYSAEGYTYILGFTGDPDSLYPLPSPIDLLHRLDSTLIRI